MKETVKKYIELELTALTREERPKLLLSLVKEIEKDGWDFADLLVLIKQTEKKSVWIRQPLFEKIIYPILKREIENENVEAIKVLIRLEPNLGAYQRKFRTDEPEVWQLVERGLELSSDDRELLARHESILRRWLDYSTHETPDFVIYSDVEKTTEAHCDKLLEILDKYKLVCRKLNLSENKMRKELVEDCQLHFTNYKEYLQNQNQFVNYEDFLRKKGIL